MTRRPWSRRECVHFLALTDRCTADQVALLTFRSKAAVQAMRRKLKQLRALGVTDKGELADLLQVHIDVVLGIHLAGIRARAAEPLVPVKRFMRRSRYYRKPHLVGPYKRNKEMS